MPNALQSIPMDFSEPSTNKDCHHWRKYKTSSSQSSSARSESGLIVNVYKQKFKSKLAQTLSMAPEQTKINRDMADLRAECSTLGWDGYQAKPLCDHSIQNARNFIALLENESITYPDLSAEPNGLLVMDWEGNGYQIGISIDRDECLAWGGIYKNKHGEYSHIYGDSPYRGAIPHHLKALLLQVVQ